MSSNRPEFCRRINCPHYPSPGQGCWVREAITRWWPTKKRNILKAQNQLRLTEKGRVELRRRCYRIAIEGKDW